MREKGIEGKIDNVYERFSPGAREALFDLVERHADTTKMGLTSTKVSHLAAYGARFPHAPLHYDGAVSEEALDALKEISAGHVTTVWMHMGTPLVAWSKLPPATPEIVAAVKAYQVQNGKVDEIVLPADTMKEFEEVFLCGMTLKEMKKQLPKVKVRVNRAGGAGLVEILATR